MSGRWVHDGRVAQLRQELERAVKETGSLTHERVLRISILLDRAILAYFQQEECRSDSSGN
ncbi:Spo0E family sporulation regulatory protein-aspartic acid phosphatase [Sulfobacillus harzensis]|uniref:Aspartyl-phosphate phosphatase Spo0E family protein n=1 Tax=Sulfobacillus harzensis TaxID=2729629 RepID=A0A7Y0L2A3_9FIRM|nr:aspartyl-phosphate phosphatase Spo0E family protein [Sulfobacillus harzensis]